MLPIERETRRRPVIKRCGIKSYNLKFFAVVVAVAVSTPLAGQVGVDSPRGVHGGFDFRVAIDTLVVGQGLPVRMARCAFADSFQLAVRADELAR